MFKILLLLLSIILLVVLLGTYIYSYKFINYINSKPNCSKCISNNYKCNKILHFAPLILIGFMIINILYNLNIIRLNTSILLLFSLSNFVIYVWFISCLYHNMKNITINTCPCVKNNELSIKNLKITSTILYYLMFVPIIIIILSIVLFPFMI